MIHITSIRDTFLYRGQILTVKISREVETQYVRLETNSYSECVKPVENGFLTRPNSEIASSFGSDDIMLIPSSYGEKYQKILESERAKQNELYKMKWESQFRAGLGGLVYGSINPGQPAGWNLLVLMRLPSGLLSEYSYKNNLFIGESEACEAIRNLKGIDGTLIQNGLPFPVTFVGKTELRMILKGRG